MKSYLPPAESSHVGPWFIPAIIGGTLLVMGALALTGTVKLQGKRRGRR